MSTDLPPTAVAAAVAPGRRRALVAAAALGTLGLLGGWQTFSAWTDTTSNAASSFQTGTLKITDDDGATAMYNVSGIKPGDTMTKCINVQNAGTTGFSTVNLWAAQTGDANLASKLKVTVRRGTGATGGVGFSCAGFVSPTAIVTDVALSALPSTGSPLADTQSWGAGAVKSYEVTVTLPLAETDATLQNKTAGLTWNWDALQ